MAPQSTLVPFGSVGTVNASAQILNGPSKYELMFALFGRTSEKLYPVTFKVKKGDEVKELIMHVVSVSIEDGSGESWNIETQSADFQLRFSGYYRTDRRTGVLTPKSK